MTLVFSRIRDGIRLQSEVQLVESFQFGQPILQNLDIQLNEIWYCQYLTRSLARLLILWIINQSLAIGAAYKIWL